MVFIPGLGGSSFPGGQAGIPGPAGSAGATGPAGTDAQLGGAGYSYLFDDFITPSPQAVGWTVSNFNGSSAKTSTGVDSTNKALGVVSLGSGTTSTGRYMISFDADNCALGGFATFDQEWRVYLPVLSDVTNRYVLRIGLLDVVDASSVVDGVYFEYLEGTSNNWRYCTSSNSSRTETSSSIAVVAGSFVKIRLVFAPALASFYVDGVLAGTIATNLPTGAGRTFGIVAGIRKTAGATERFLNIDYHKLIVDWTVDR